MHVPGLLRQDEEHPLSDILGEVLSDLAGGGTIDHGHVARDQFAERRSIPGGELPQ
jgi:hypothetical protein